MRRFELEGSAASVSCDNNRLGGLMMDRLLREHPPVRADGAHGDSIMETLIRSPTFTEQEYLGTSHRLRAQSNNDTEIFSLDLAEVIR